MTVKKMFKMSILGFLAGTVVDRLLWPYFLTPHLTWAVYHDFLRKVLPELLQTRNHLWYMNDLPPPHYLLACWEFEQRVSGKRIKRVEHGLLVLLV
jgi:hypothetical protein